VAKLLGHVLPGRRLQFFARRYRFFYDQLAPMLELYRVRWAHVTIKSFTIDGYVSRAEAGVYWHICL